MPATVSLLRLQMAKRAMVLAHQIAELPQDTIGLSSIGWEIGRLVEALIPKFDKTVTPYSPKEISKIDEKKLALKRKSDVGIIDNSFPEEVDYGTHNILTVWDRAKKDLPPEEFEFWTKWYFHAYEDIQKMAAKYNIPFNLVAGVVAILSPATKWLPNLQVAERVIRLASSFLEYGGRHVFETKILKLGKLILRLMELEKEWHGKIRKERIPMGMRGEVYTKLGAIRRVLKKKRIAYQAMGKEYKDLIKTHLGELSGSSERIGNFMESYPRNVRKALNLLESEDFSKWLVGPKVNAFYKALVEPQMTETEMVIDGHAVQLWLGSKNPIGSAPKPLGNRRKKILQSFKDAADARGVSTRAMQSICWYFFKSVVEDDINVEQQNLSL